jgi:hypothetical protein
MDSLSFFLFLVVFFHNERAMQAFSGNMQFSLHGRINISRLYVLPDTRGFLFLSCVNRHEHDYRDVWKKPHRNATQMNVLETVETGKALKTC